MTKTSIRLRSLDSLSLKGKRSQEPKYRLLTEQRKDAKRLTVFHGKLSSSNDHILFLAIFRFR